MVDDEPKAGAATSVRTRESETRAEPAKAEADGAAGCAGGEEFDRMVGTAIVLAYLQKSSVIPRHKLLEFVAKVGAGLVMAHTNMGDTFIAYIVMARRSRPVWVWPI